MLFFKHLATSDFEFSCQGEARSKDTEKKQDGIETGFFDSVSVFAVLVDWPTVSCYPSPHRFIMSVKAAL